MTPYEELLAFAEENDVIVLEHEFQGNFKGIYCDGIAFINKKSSTAEKRCTLAEELGHHYTASSNIIELDTTDKIKQELLGHKWAIEKLLPLSSIVDAIINGCDCLAMLAEHLEVTPAFLQEAIVYYGQKHSSGMEYKNHLIYFSEESLIVSPIVDEVI